MVTAAFILQMHGWSMRRLATTPSRKSLCRGNTFCVMTMVRMKTSMGEQPLFLMTGSNAVGMRRAYINSIRNGALVRVTVSFTRMMHPQGWQAAHLTIGG